MKGLIDEMNYFHHYKRLDLIKKRRTNLKHRTFRISKQTHNSNDIFKSGGHFQLNGRYINEDEYFDQVHKDNILLAKRIDSIERRKKSFQFYSIRKIDRN